MRLRCFFCGKSVSTEVPDDTVVRAVLICPECIEAVHIPDVPTDEWGGVMSRATSETTIRLFEDPTGCSTCSCGATIRWHETLKGHRMPMNPDAVPRRSEHLDGRVVAYYAVADSHWATCPNRGEFRRPRATARA